MQYRRVARLQYSSSTAPAEGDASILHLITDRLWEWCFRATIRSFGLRRYCSVQQYLQTAGPWIPFSWTNRTYLLFNMHQTRAQAIWRGLGISNNIRPTRLKAKSGQMPINILAYLQGRDFEVRVIAEISQMVLFTGQLLLKVPQLPAHLAGVCLRRLDLSRQLRLLQGSSMGS